MRKHKVPCYNCQRRGLIVVILHAKTTKHTVNGLMRKTKE